jgi:hypothetical protein
MKISGLEDRSEKYHGKQNRKTKRWKIGVQR